jgi:hypothetical protein
MATTTLRKPLRDALHQTVWDAARDAGGAAAQAEPTLHGAQKPLMVWITIRPGGSSFARWLKRNGHAHNPRFSGGGVAVQITVYGAAPNRKRAYAVAVAEYLCAVGIDAQAEEWEG